MFRFFDLSLGIVFLSGAYGFLASLNSGWSFPISFLCGTLLATGVGCALLLVLVQPLARYQATGLDITLCALGAYIIGLNTLSMIFGDELRRPPDLWLSAPINIAGGIISGAQLSIVVVALCAYLAAALIMKRTSLGRTFRALSNNPKLARDIGLPLGPVRLLTTAFGSVLVATAGILVAVDVGVRPSSAFPLVIPALGAVLAFSGPNLTRLFVGTFAVAAAGELGGFAFGQQWRELSLFAVIGLYLVVMPRLHAWRRR